MAHAYAFGEFRLELRSRRLLRGGAAVPVTVKGFEILSALVEQAGRLVEKDDLMRRVWPDAIVEEANLSQQIFLLRKMLGEAPKEHRYIQTVPRRGYRFVAEVVECGSDTDGRTSVRPATDAIRTGAPAAGTLKLSLLLDEGRTLAIGACPPMALSPSGRLLAFVAAERAGTALHVRALDRGESTRIARTEGATAPFFSPDSRWIAYTASGKLYKVLAAGGPPMAICEAGTECRGATWTSRHEIVFAPTPASGLAMVSAEGGAPRSATTLDYDTGERTHRWPAALPDGRHVLLTVARAGSASFDDGDVAIASLDTGARHVVVPRGSCARYLPTGHLVYMRGGSIMAVAFDAERLQTVGSPIPVVNQVMTQPTGAGHFTFSQDGCLVYLTGESHDVRQRLVWVNGEQAIEPVHAAEAAIEEPRLSPDGTRVAFGRRGATNDIWMLELADGGSTRLTFDGDNFAPIWSPDGQHVTFSSNRTGPCQIFRQATDGSGLHAIAGGDFDLVPGSWSPDGETLLFTEYNSGSGATIWACAPASGEPPRPIVRSRGNDFGPAFAPDGRSFAYTSDESGRFEVYLFPFPGPGTKSQVSVDGGSEPVWSRDGCLFYRRGSSVMKVEVDLAQRRRAAVPRVVADGPYQAGAVTGLPNYDVAEDGRLLLIEQTAAQVHPDRLSVTVNWFDDVLARLA